MSGIFDLNNIFDDNDIGQKKQKQNEIEIKSVNIADTAAIHQKTLEHFCGFYDMINFMNKKIYASSQLRIENNIVFLDEIASRDFFLSPAISYKKHVRQYNKKTEQTEIIVIEENQAPFITCKYDFIHWVQWEHAYVHDHYLYLVAAPKKTGSQNLSSLNYFILAIYCDNISKFSCLYGKDTLDFRKIKFHTEEYEDENGDEQERAIMYVEDRYVEQSIGLTYLNDDNIQLLYQYNEKEMKAAQEHYKSIFNLSSDGIDKMMGKLLNQDASLNQHYNINFGRNKVRDFVNQAQTIDDLGVERYDELV